MVMTSKERCAVCGKHLGDNNTEIIGLGTCHPDCAEKESAALEEDAMREMGDDRYLYR